MKTAAKRNRKTEKKTSKKISRASARRDVKVKSAEDRLCWKLVGVGLLALAIFAAIALATYQPGNATGNLVGVLGHGFALGGYAALGLAVWCVPVSLVIGG